MQPLPYLTDAEWQMIKPLLSAGKATRRRHADRAVLSALFYCLAIGSAVEHVPSAYQIGHRTLRTRVARWKADGTWPSVARAGEPVVARMCQEINESEEDLLSQCARVFGWGL